MALKLALLEPAAIVTDGGRVKDPLPLVSETVTAAGPAALESVTVHVANVPGVRLFGVQESWLTTVAVPSDMEADCERPLSEAVTDAVEFVSTAAAVAEKLPVVKPAGMLRFAATASTGLLLLSETVAAAGPAALERVTVHTAELPELRLVGEQVNSDTPIGAWSAINALCDVEFREAVTDADWSEPMLPAVALNVAVVAPIATVVFAGTLSKPLLLVKDTDAAAGPAALERVTVQAA